MTSQTLTLTSPTTSNDLQIVGDRSQLAIITQELTMVIKDIISTDINFEHNVSDMPVFQDSGSLVKHVVISEDLELNIRLRFLDGNFTKGKTKLIELDVFQSLTMLQLLDLIDKKIKKRE